MSTDNIGDRMKRYEAAYNFKIVPRSCLFIRVDGKAFHTFTKGCEKPFDQKLIDAMVSATQATAEQMMGFKLAYTQSDEATFMLSDTDKLTSEGWFNYELNKVVSISASLFSTSFNAAYGSLNAVFDSRAFIVPREDAPNVFLWRQRDWERNSIQMLARAHYSHSQCNNKKTPQLHEMLHDKGVNWTHLSDQHKNATFVDRYKELHHQKLDYQAIDQLIDLQPSDPDTNKRQDKAQS